MKPKTYVREKEAMRKAFRKLKNGSGFTLAETLMAVLIVLLVSAVVAAGMPAAVTAYTKAVDAANAQVLLSTTVNALRSELSTAWQVETETVAATGSSPGTTYVTYFSSRTGAKARLFVDGDTIKVEDYVPYDEISGAGGSTSDDDRTHDLISEKTRTFGADSTYGISFSNLDVDGNTVTFGEVIVSKGENDDEIAKAGPVTIRLLRENFSIPEI